VKDLYDNVQGWSVSEHPKMDPEIVEASRVVRPSERAESESDLAAFFSRQSVSAHETVLFFASNPSLVRLYILQAGVKYPRFEFIATQIVKSLAFFTALETRSRTQSARLDHTLLVDLAVSIREGMSEIEQTIAGYFAYRHLLEEVGIAPTFPSLGVRVLSTDLSSETHKIVRDPGEKGQMRLFGLGLRVDNQVVGSARVSKSGEEDDRD
jgi:hypothetical protein